MAFLKNNIIKLLEELGIYQIEYPTPFPQAGNVYSYIIPGINNNYILFDAGLKWENNEELFFNFIKEKNIDINSISDIYLSHGHVDHYGLAKIINDKSGAKVYIHEKDKNKISDDYNKNYVKESGKYINFFKRYGLDDTTVEFIINTGKGLNYFTNQIKDIDTLLGGEKIDSGFGELEVVYLPGHTPGSIGLYNKKNKILFSGDSLLAKISPNPIVELGKAGEEDRFKSLPVYYNTLDKMYNMDIDLVIPGHGECIINHQRTIENLKHFYKRRQEKILNVLSEEMTVYEISVTLFPKYKEQIFLIFSEILGNIDILEEMGYVEKIDFGNKIAYRRKTDELVVI